LRDAVTAAIIADKKSIIRVVGGGALGNSINSLEILLKLHRREIARFRSADPDRVSTPRFEWKYVTHEHAGDTLEITHVEDVLPYALQYDGTFGDLLPPGLLLAAEVELIFPASVGDVLPTDGAIGNAISSYMQKTLLMGSEHPLRDLYGEQFTRGVIPASPESNRSEGVGLEVCTGGLKAAQPMFYFHDIEPRLL
jgi:hypothetical protein